MSNLHNRLTYATRFSTAIAVTVGLGEDEEGVSRLSETLTPTIDIYARDEWALARGELPWAFYRSQGAVAGEQSSCAIVNNTSDVLLIIEALKVKTGGTSGVYLKFPTVAAVTATLSANGSYLPRDRRHEFEAGRGTLYVGTNAGLITGEIFEALAATAAGYATAQNLAVILPPSRAMLVENTTANESIEVVARGYERMALPRELP